MAVTVFLAFSAGAVGLATIHSFANGNPSLGTIGAVILIADAALLTLRLS